MRTSSLSLLKAPTVVVLAAGHGGSDPGAVNAPHKERDQVISIVNETANLLRAQGVQVQIAPHSHDTPQSIQWVNSNFNFGDAWVLEFHRDSANGLNWNDASRRCGIYYGTSQNSKDIGDFVRNSFIANGAHSNSWTRPDTASNHGSLGWIRQTQPVAHLLELAFMQGDNTPTHLSWLAKIAATAIVDAFT